LLATIELFFLLGKFSGDVADEVGFLLQYYNLFATRSPVRSPQGLCVSWVFATIVVGFAPNETFFAILVYYGSKSRILVEIDFVRNIFFATLIYY
jgi:hypothetical protein